MKSMKKVLALVLALALVMTTFVACGGGEESSEPSGDEVYTFKVQCAYPPGDQAYDVHMPLICDLITEYTDGQIQWEYYQPGAICEPGQAPASLSKGILDAALSAPNDTAAIVPAAYAEQGIPFWWATADQVYSCFYEQGMLDYLREEYAKANIYYGAWHGEGGYMLMTDFPVATVDDLKGKKVRASTSYATLMNIVGGSPVQMSGGDIYMGMKLGTIDGYIYSVAELENSALKEVTTDVMIPAGCMGAPCNFLFSMDAWNSLTPELQEKVNEALEQSFWDTTAAAEEIDSVAIEAAKAYGVNFNEVTGAELDAFYAAGEQVLADLEAQYPEAQKGFDILKAWKEADAAAAE